MTSLWHTNPERVLDVVANEVEVAFLALIRPGSRPEPVPSWARSPVDQMVSAEEILFSLLIRLRSALYGEGKVLGVQEFLNPSEGLAGLEGLPSSDETRRRQITNARSVFIVLGKEDFEPSEGRRALKTQPAHLRHRLCRSRDQRERQPTTRAFGSGFLVGQSTVLTAHHCIDEGKTGIPFGDLRFVFDYEQDAMGNVNQLAEDSVYAPVEVLNRSPIEDQDWALIRLDRKVSDRNPCTFRAEGRIEDGASVFAIGHPLGLPKRVAAEGRVLTNSAFAFFTASLNIFGGNSGSPVINAQDHLVEGVLTTGDGVVKQCRRCRPRCQYLAPCNDFGCKGERVTRITEIFRNIKLDSLP